MCYWIPDNRWNYIKTLIKDQCVPGSKEEKLLNNLFKRYTSIVKCPNKTLGYTTALKHEILYDGPKSIFIPPYKCAAAEEIELNNEILRMIQADLIEVSKSGFNLPILIVRKKGGGIRIVADTRQLSKYICKLRLPLPAINTLIRSLHNAKTFCVVDLKEAFFPNTLRWEK